MRLKCPCKGVFSWKFLSTRSGRLVQRVSRNTVIRTYLSLRRVTRRDRSHRSTGTVDSYDEFHLVARINSVTNCDQPERECKLVERPTGDTSFMPCRRRTPTLHAETEMCVAFAPCEACEEERVVMNDGIQVDVDINASR